MGVKNLAVKEQIKTDIGYDLLFEDGSKEYGTLNFGRFHIERPEVVEFIENILSGGFVGWGYMTTLIDARKSGFLTEGEYLDIIKILD